MAAYAADDRRAFETLFTRLSGRVHGFFLRSFSDAAGEGARADLQESVRQAIARLPESQRMVVHLHRYEGMTFPEIAQVLSTTEGAVKLRAFRAYETLRESLKDLVAKGEAA